MISSKENESAMYDEKYEEELKDLLSYEKKRLKKNWFSFVYFLMIHIYCRLSFLCLYAKIYLINLILNFNEVYFIKCWKILKI